MNPPALDLAEGFADHAVAWAKRHTADPRTLSLLRRAARLVSLATAQGHVCLPLEVLADINEPTAPLRERLFASGIVATPETPAPLPLVLDAQDRLYLTRYFNYECRLAAALRRLAVPAPLPPERRDELAAGLDRLFAGNAARLGQRPDWQKLAAALAVYSRLCLISGGPGTGKTYTVVAVLASLLALDPELRIALAAPTGKAAARMMESLRGRSAHLPEPLRTRLPDTAQTVHRLLGGGEGGFRYHRGNPLPFDALVVDEASMLDLALATHLFEALPPHARIVLLGDKDQLAAVEAGAVFAELSAQSSLSAPCAHALAGLTGIPLQRFAPQHAQTTAQAELPFDTPPASPLKDCAVWLTESMRFAADSGIGRLAAQINAGNGDAALAAVSDPAVRWLDDPGGTPGADTVNAIRDGYAGYLAALAQPDPDTLFRAFARFRVLCAVHDTPRGTAALNAHVAAWTRQRTGSPPTADWYTGRAVIMRRNDYDASLFNGDIGLCVMEEDGTPRVHFPDDAGGYRALAPSRLPEHDDAFALSVHKSQGSEFDAVLLILPQQAGAILARELLYTGVTRALSTVTLAGASAVFIAACATRTARRSGLMARLQEKNED